MLKFRQSQLDQMNKVREEEYVRSLSAYFRKNVPQLVGSRDDAQLESLVADALPKARAYGIRSETGIAAFVGMTLAAGPGFDEEPEIRAYLIMERPDPDLKMRKLFELTLDDLELQTGR